jgi:hypothetical protein
LRLLEGAAASTRRRNGPNWYSRQWRATIVVGVNRLSRYQFTDAERYAVYTVHGERCYLCTKPLDMASMEIDHVIPEALIGSPQLPKILSSLGRPEDFKINGFENWLPSCRRCNGEKTKIVFEPSPIIQIRLQKLAEKREEAEAAAAEIVSNRKFSLALNTILRAGSNRLSAEQLASLRSFVEFHAASPHRENPSAPVRLTPLYEVLSDNGRLRVVRGPFGVGGGPSNPFPEATCPSCGFAAFNGARCVICGAMDDD